MNSAAYTIPAVDIAGLLPEIVLAGAGVLVLCLDAFLGRRRVLSSLVALAGVAVAAYYALCAPGGASFGGLLETSALAAGARWIVLGALGLSILGSHGYLRRESLPPGEYLALLLWAGVGASLFARSTELITLFVGLELLSVCLYALTGYHRRLRVSTEAGIKYFLMGAVLSAFLLLGIALVFAETGTTSLTSLAALGGGSGSPIPPMLLAGLALVFGGLAFKLGLAPLHAWAPDAYQGAPSPFVAFLAVAPKAAAAVALVRLTGVAVGGGFEDWDTILSAVAVLSMLVGNLIALAQRDLKRMLAYSGIAHMGYLLVPIVGLNAQSLEAILIYLAAYALMTGGGFVVVGYLFPEPGEQHLISDLSGWGYRYPLFGLCLSVFMLSLGGIPPTAGFIGKYLIFVHAVETGHLALAVTIVVTSLVGVFYYLRVVYTLYMQPESRQSSLGPDWLATAATVAAAAATLLLGALPGPILGAVARTLGITF